MRSTMSLFAVTVISLCLVQPLKAQPLITVPLFEVTEFGHILGLSTVDPAALYVRLDVPFVNSEEPATPGQQQACGAGRTRSFDYYSLDLKEPEAKLSEAILLGAFLSGKTVRFFLKGCINLYPRIIGIDVGAPPS